MIAMVFGELQFTFLAELPKRVTGMLLEQYAVQVISELLSHHQCFVREAALKSLSQIAKKSNDEQAFDSVIMLMEDRDQRIARTATTTLVQITAKGNRHAIHTLIDKLASSRPTVRQAAAQALGQLAEKGDELAIEALSNIIGDPCWYVRRTAVHAAARIAERGDQNVVSVASVLMKDKNRQVRQAAAQALRWIRQEESGSSSPEDPLEHVADVQTK